MKNLIVLLILLLFSEVGYSQIPFSGNNYHWYGPNTTWGAYLQVGGQSPIGDASAIFTTNGNLHLDAKSGNSIYLSRYTPGNILVNVGGGLVLVRSFHRLPWNYRKVMMSS